MSERLKLYRVTQEIVYEYMVAARSREEAEEAGVDLGLLLDEPDRRTTAVRVIEPAHLYDWADTIPFGDDDAIGDRTCREILEDAEPTEADLERAGQLNVLTAP